MITLKEIKDNISSKIVIPREFDDFYYWHVGQKNKNPNCHFFLGFEWNNNDGLLSSLFGNKHYDRFGVFASGGDGSLYAFWLDDQERQRVVYISSDGGSNLVLGNTFIEFLQYLSIGYSDPDITDFDLTYEQIRERDKIDYSYFTTERLNEYHQMYSKPLETEKGIKELFGQDIDDETLKMLLEINQNALLSMPKMDADVNERAKTETTEKNKIYHQQFIEFRQWLIKKYKVKLPAKGTEILNLNDKSFENWAKNNWLQRGV